MIAFALSALIASISAAAEAPNGYEFNVVFERMEGEMKNAREIRVSCIPVRKASIRVGKEGEGLTAELDVRDDTREIDARLTLCRPDVSPCDVIARPRLIFAMGEEASFRGSTEDGLIYSVSFKPCRPAPE